MMYSSAVVIFLILYQQVFPVFAGRESEAWTHAYSADSTTTLSAVPQHEDTECPTWFVPVTKNGSTWCECRDKIIQGGTVLRCPKEGKICIMNCLDRPHSGDNLNISILSAFCMTHDFDKKQTVLALCPYNHQPNSSDFFVSLPSNISDLNGFMCRVSRREGKLCNKCIKNTGPSIFSDSANCLPVNDTVLSWFYFVALTFIPPTGFFLAVMFCKVRTTTGPLNALIFFSQGLSVIKLLQKGILSSALGITPEKSWRSVSEGLRVVLEELVGTFYTFWYNQYLWSILFAVNTKISSIQVQALGYGAALYPLLLILISCVVIWLHNHGCRLLMCMWKLFRRCTGRFKIKWDPINSIMHTFATFILLIYTRILVVSFNLLAPSRIYNQSGELDYKILSYDSSIHFLSRQHTPYVILSLSMLVVFCGLPLLILLLYPMTCFQILLNKTPVLFSESVRHFCNAFTGCYKSRVGPERMERRYFASFYFLIRIIYFASLYFVEYSYVWLALILVPLLVSILFIALQPYKKKWLNVVDSVTFGLTALVTILYAYNIHVARIPLWIPDILLVAPFVYFLGLILHMVVIKVRGCYLRIQMNRRGNQNNEAHDINFDESLFERAGRDGKNGKETAPLLNPLQQVQSRN